MNVDFNFAFILHHRPYRESSVLLDVYSQGHGRIHLLAKGVRKNKRSQSGLLQLYQPLLLSWFGRSDLQLLRAAEAEGPAYLLQAESALCGLYINELMVKLLPMGEAEPGLFMAYQQALTGLQLAESNEITLRLFEKHLLSHLGYGLVLEHEAETGDSITVEQSYYYVADKGLYRWQTGQDYNRISGRSLQHLIDEQGFDAISLSEIKQLMRMVIHFYLAGKRLRSRELFSQKYKTAQH
ncbi:MAG: DNA repair protein RecO (recombination protein O) [Methylophagaceae bacterium]